MNFIDWDYRTGIATRYKRIGECNQCGDCCKIQIDISMVDGDKNSHAGTTTDEQNRWSEIGHHIEEPNRKFVRFHDPEETIHHQCVALGPDNLCTANGNKPWCCTIWPTAPSDIKQFPNCSYEFIEADNWDFNEEE